MDTVYRFKITAAVRDIYEQNIYITQLMLIQDDLKFNN